MTTPFKGTINIDIRDSVPDWEPYAQPQAPEGAPNVLYVVLDDVGFSAMEPWGGLIETPNINRLAARGLVYTNWHTTALCSPTRSSLLTGRNHTTNGMACIAEATSGFPGSNGHIPFECATIAEVLGERGWNTYMLGKWHLCPADELNMASTKRNWPVGRGFERYYGFLGGETNQWYPDLVYDNHYADQPKGPEEGYHLTEDLTDKAIQFIRDAKVVAPDKPFFMYFCPGATHAPHHAPKEWIDRYRGRFDMGYEAYREQVFERQKKMGILAQNAELSPINPYAATKSHDGEHCWPEVDTVRPWDSLSDDEKRLFCRMAEVYAGFLSHTDHHIGRLLDYLEESGQLENTIIVFVSDNGASGERGPNGSVNENKFFNGIPDDMEENLKYLDVLGGPETYNHYPTGWTFAFNTPFKMWKRYNFEGGVADPLIVSWPKGIKAAGELRHQYCHATDVVPTVYDCLGIEMPAEVKGYTQIPLEGQSFRYSFDDATAPTQKETAFFTMLGSRAIWHKGWKAVTAVPAAPGGWPDHMQDRWELFDTEDDPTEMHDLADQYPDKLQELIALWFFAAGEYNGLPIESRNAVEILTTPRPEIGKPRDRYTYYPDCAEVPEAAVNIRNRSYTIAAEVDVHTPEAGGVLFSHGAKFGGHSLYVKDRKLKYAYNFCGIVEQMVVSTEDVPSGEVILSAAFVREGQDMPTHGTLTLYIDDKAVGSAQIRTQPGNFSLVGEGLNVGKDIGEPVTDDYAGVRPWAFTGGTIRQVIVDVSGEPYVDVEKEALAMMSRE